ncbi:replication A 70 kDa DNA-binding subunit A-like [Olea europaea subsp. europaea]|uniref:Replication A 70 kDa DNA-binding subunit A-like n=1 Tax=Olea europaea subsp. europaea TaxID=158383 RepID=A0A8S0UCN4_OLEEU|nr:replication A 70 kDa DNA-binding subunit A-like [Olea europaea subsp. europaea]
MPSVNLTEGAISMLARGDVQATEIKPVLQVSDVRLVNTQNQNSNNERYRILLSDGLFLQQAMLATQKNELVRTDKLQKGSIVQLTEFVCNVIQTRIGFGTGYREPSASTMNYSGNTSNLARETGVSANEVRPYSNQYGGSTLASSGLTGIYTSCNSCGGMGHSSLNCPNVVTGQGQSHGSSYGNRETLGASAGGECFKCHQIGHWAKDCPGLSNAPPAYGSSNSIPGRYGNVPKQHVGGF